VKHCLFPFNSCGSAALLPFVKYELPWLAQRGKQVAYRWVNCGLRHSIYFKLFNELIVGPGGATIPTHYKPCVSAGSAPKAQVTCQGSFEKIITFPPRLILECVTRQQLLGCKCPTIEV